MIVIPCFGVGTTRVSARVYTGSTVIPAIGAGNPSTVNDSYESKPGLLLY